MVGGREAGGAPQPTLLNTVFPKSQCKTILNMCSVFVTPQKNALLTTQSNLNDKKMASK